jgi:hypothetical protein
MPGGCGGSIVGGVGGSMVGGFGGSMVGGCAGGFGGWLGTLFIHDMIFSSHYRLHCNATWNECEICELKD